MSELVSSNCKLADCTVATTGKCIEGLELELCPNYVRAEAASDKSSANEDSGKGTEELSRNVPQSDMMILPSGLDLDPLTGARITRARLTQVIVIAGDKDSGKTTLVSVLYDRFQKGSFAGYMFAGSQTLPGFERRCFPSRIVSDRVRADTIRTPRGDGQKLLHLKVRADDLSRPSQDILLSDISGEFFKDACNSTEGCRQLEILRRADHVALCLDGERLARAAYRHETFHTGVLLLRSALDAGMIGPRTFVEVLFTKRDLLGPEGSPALEYVASVRERIADQFKNRFAGLSFFEVAAAAPEKVDFPLAYGLDGVVPGWVEETALYTTSKNFDSRAIALSLARTEFDRFVLSSEGFDF